MSKNSFIYPSESADDMLEECWCCSDSSSFASGYVLFQPPECISGQVVILDFGARWSVDETEWHIFVKEFVAAKRTIIAAIGNKTRQHIILGIDNAGAYHVLRRMYSSNSFVIPHLRELAEVLLKSKSLLTCVLLKSAENAADDVSRLRQTITSQTLLTRGIMARQQMRAALNGYRLNTYDDTRAPQVATGVRHRTEDAIFEPERLSYQDEDRTEMPF